MQYYSESHLHVEKGRLDALFGSNGAIVAGTIATTLAVVLSYLVVPDPVLISIATCFLASGAYRVYTHYGYWRAKERLREDPDADITPQFLRYWRLRCISGGTLYAALLGAWCFHTIEAGGSEFAILTAVTATMANTVGVAGRNYSSRLYVNLQTLCMGAPMVGALVLYADWMYSVLGLFYAVHFLAVVSITSTLRKQLDTSTRDASEVRKSAQRLSTAFETVPSGLLMFQPDGFLALANTEARSFLEIPLEGPVPFMTRKAILTRMRGLLHVSSAERLAFKKMVRPVPDAAHTTILGGYEHRTTEGLVLNHRNGGTYRIASGQSSEGSLILRIDDVTAELHNQRKIITLSRLDALTGLANRSWFFSRALDRLKTVRDADVMVAVLDVNDFKVINDTMGHAIGDAVLRQLAQNLDDLVGDHGVCGRLGGDEFILVINLTTGQDPQAWCYELESAVNFTLNELSREIQIRTAIGVYGLRDSDRHAAAKDAKAVMDSAIMRADFALYRAKSSPLHDLCLYDDSMDDQLEREVTLRKDLAVAIRNGTLETHYQPIVHAQTGRLKGVEALARWNHPLLGAISPAEFIPLAEQSGVIRELTAWQLRDACRTCASWPDPMSVSVNLSAKDFASAAILDHISHALSQSGLAPNRLMVEITETSLMEMQAPVTKILADIKAMGVKVALDDFGTGYCSLSYLHNLPFDILKVDRTFLQGIADDHRHLAVLATIARLARQLEKEIVIEGVETGEQLALLNNSVEFDYVQGYYFGRPLPVQDISALVYAFTPEPAQTVEPCATLTG